MLSPLENWHPKYSVEVAGVYFRAQLLIQSSGFLGVDIVTCRAALLRAISKTLQC